MTATMLNRLWVASDSGDDSMRIAFAFFRFDLCDVPIAFDTMGQADKQPDPDAFPCRMFVPDLTTTFTWRHMRKA